MWLKFFSRSLGVVVSVVQYGCIAHCTLEYVGDIVVCKGPSMEPTIQSKDICVTEHISVRRRQVQKRDVVISRSPTNPREFICKRVIAMEGDRVHLEDNTVKYIPKGHVWLEGDNHDNSTDSHNYGPIPYGLLRSRVIYKIWPINQLGPLGFQNDR
ncbi:hypothetical protein ScPMuIL_015011 [Solemya velum]